MAKSVYWHNHIWETLYRMGPTWMGGCRGVALQTHVRNAGFRTRKREFISQLTFPSEVIYGEVPIA